MKSILAHQGGRNYLVFAKIYRGIAMSEPHLTLADVASVTQPDNIRAIEWQEEQPRTTLLHSHSQGQLIGSLAGMLSISTPLGWWVVPTSHAIWIPPNISHAVCSHGPVRGWSVYVSEPDCKKLRSTPQTLRVTTLFKELVHRVAFWNEKPRTEKQKRLGRIVIDEIGDLVEEPLGLSNPTDPRLRRIADAILADLADTRSVEDLARWGGISPRTLARRFQAETGLGIVAWRQRARTLKAVTMLADGLGVTTVALDVGYSNVSAFIAMFRRVTGLTPGEYHHRQR
jgi:AraC-like DNA-binding protein